MMLSGEHLTTGVIGRMLGITELCQLPSTCISQSMLPKEQMPSISRILAASVLPSCVHSAVPSMCSVGGRGH